MATINSEYPELEHAFNILRSDPQKSLILCDEFLENHPGHPLGLLQKFFAQQSLGELQAALETAQQMAIVEPEDDLNHYLVAETSYQLGKYLEAIESGKKALELNIDATLGNDPHRLIAMSYAHKGDLPNALDFANQAEKIDSNEWGTPNETYAAKSKEDFVSKLRAVAELKL